MIVFCCVLSASNKSRDDDDDVPQRILCTKLLGQAKFSLKHKTICVSRMENRRKFEFDV